MEFSGHRIPLVCVPNYLFQIFRWRISFPCSERAEVKLDERKFNFPSIYHMLTARCHQITFYLVFPSWQGLWKNNSLIQLLPKICLSALKSKFSTMLLELAYRESIVAAHFCIFVQCVHMQFWDSHFPCPLMWENLGIYLHSNRRCYFCISTPGVLWGGVKCYRFVPVYANR